MIHNAIMFGAGGWAHTWITTLLPPFQDWVRIAALVDIESGVLDRIECADGAVVVIGDQLIVERHTGDGLNVTPVSLPKADQVYHLGAIVEFLDWLGGGPAPETLVQNNLNSVAAMLAALRSAERSQWSDVQTAPITTVRAT